MEDLLKAARDTAVAYAKARKALWTHQGEEDQALVEAVRAARARFMVAVYDIEQTAHAAEGYHLYKGYTQ